VKQAFGKEQQQQQQSQAHDDDDDRRDGGNKMEEEEIPQAAASGESVGSKIDKIFRNILILGQWKFFNFSNYILSINLFLLFPKINFQLLSQSNSVADEFDKYAGAGGRQGSGSGASTPNTIRSGSSKRMSVASRMVGGQIQANQSTKSFP
jgi:hypothetical protein